MGEAFPTAVYLLCFATSAACAVLLARSYWRTGARLVMWSAFCFGLLALNNAFVVMDLVLFEDINLQLPRLFFSTAAVAVLLFGFIWDLDE